MVDTPYRTTTQTKKNGVKNGKKRSQGIGQAGRPCKTGESCATGWANLGCTKINAVCSSENAELVYSVKKVSTGAEIEVNGNEFTPEEAGVYQVTVSVAGGGADPYTYNVFAEAAAKDGEVEVFGDAWEEKESFIGGKRQDWEIVSSEECNLVDPYGRAGTFAKYSTDRAYIPLFINIRQDNDYYKQLAEEGYTHVSMWIYMDSQKPQLSIVSIILWGRYVPFCPVSPDASIIFVIIP